MELPTDPVTNEVIDVDADELIARMRRRAMDPKATPLDFMRVVAERARTFLDVEVSTESPVAFINDLICSGIIFPTGDKR